MSTIRVAQAGREYTIVISNNGLRVEFGGAEIFRHWPEATDPTPVPQPEPTPEPEPTPDPVPDPTPDPAPNPAPVPPTPIPPSGAVGSRTLGRDITTCREPGVIVTAADVTITQALADFSDWDLGARRLIFRAHVVHLADLRSIDGVSASLPLIQCLGAGGFGLAEHVSALGCRGSMIFKQENMSKADAIRAWDMRGMSQDGLKVCGGNVIEGNRISDATFRGGAPHSDAITVMAADGGVTIRGNEIDWRYAGQSDQSGINNWFRIETYQAASNIWDDIVIEGNSLRHANDRSFAMQVVERDAPVWRGSIKVRNNVMDKAGGARKILYAPSARISEWSGNTDSAGNPIALSDA